MMKTYYMVFYSFILFGLSVNISCGEKSSKKSLTQATQKDEQGRTILASSSENKLIVQIKESAWFFPSFQRFVISREKLKNALVKRISQIMNVYHLRIRLSKGGKARFVFSATLHNSTSFHDIICRMSFNYGKNTEDLSKASIIFEDCSSSEVVFKETRFIVPYSEIAYSSVRNY